MTLYHIMLVDKTVRFVRSYMLYAKPRCVCVPEEGVYGRSVELIFRYSLDLSAVLLSPDHLFHFYLRRGCLLGRHDEQ